jgi:hypothetical protein
MIQSPYLNEVIIVGRANPFSSGITGFGNKPFFLRLNATNLTNVSCTLYGQTVNPLMEYFTAVNVASSTNGGSNGFVVAGYSDYVSGKPVWVAKLDQSGNFIWNKVYQAVSDIKPVPVAIIERVGGNYAFNYFAACTSTAGMMVLKFEDNGNRFAPSGANINDLWNEFNYNLQGTPAAASAISYKQAGSSDVGIHVYGTAPNSHYFAEAAFNGFNMVNPCPGTPCSSSYTTNMISDSPGPITSGTVGIVTTTSLTPCTVFTITSGSVTTAPTPYSFTATLPSQGSLARGVQTQLTREAENDQLSIYPNPVTGVAKINYNYKGNKTLVFQLYNSLGQIVTTINKTPNENTQFEIDFTKLNIESGVYFIKANFGEVNYRKEIIYTKN